MSDLWNGAVLTIFAREVLEGVVIIGQYRTVLLRSPEWEEPEKRKAGLRAINVAAAWATLVAIVVVACVAIPLAVLSRDFDEKVADIIEGVSKVVAAICILQLSLKIPKFLGVYASKKGQDGVTIGLSLKSIRFNVGWNIWREVAEIGVFLLPFFLTGEGAKAIPLSGLVGCVVGFAFGAIIYFANKKLKNKFWLAAFMAILLLFLSVGLFTGGCHEFEEVWGETPKVYNHGYHYEYTYDENGEVLSKEKILHASSEKQLPMAVLKPFGYSASRTQLQIACFWSWLVFGIVLHLWKWISSKKIREAQELAEAEMAGKVVDSQETTPMDQSGKAVEAEAEGSTDEENQSTEKVSVE